MNISPIIKLEEFVHSIEISFSELNNNLKKIIIDKLNNENFLDKTFKVLKIINFSILSMIVKNENVLCEIEIKAKCINILEDEIILIENDYLIEEKNLLIFYKNNVQIICYLNIGFNKNGPFLLKILKKKIISDKIIYTAEHINS